MSATAVPVASAAPMAPHRVPSPRSFSRWYASGSDSESSLSSGSDRRRKTNKAVAKVAAPLVLHPVPPLSVAHAQRLPQFRAAWQQIAPIMQLHKSDCEIVLSYLPVTTEMQMAEDLDQPEFRALQKEIAFESEYNRPTTKVLLRKVGADTLARDRTKQFEFVYADIESRFEALLPLIGGIAGYFDLPETPRLGDIPPISRTAHPRLGDLNRISAVVLRVNDGITFIQINTFADHFSAFNALIAHDKERSDIIEKISARRYAKRFDEKVMLALKDTVLDPARPAHALSAGANAAIPAPPAKSGIGAFFSAWSNAIFFGNDNRPAPARKPKPNGNANAAAPEAGAAAATAAANPMAAAVPAANGKK